MGETCSPQCAWLNECFSNCCHPDSKHLFYSSVSTSHCTIHKLRASSYLHAVASENAGDAPQSSSTRSPRSESREVLSLHTNHIFPWMSKKHTVNKMIHQLENRDGQSGGYCQATCGFASSTRETESPVEAPTNNSIINSYK